MVRQQVVEDDDLLETRAHCTVTLCKAELQPLTFCAWCRTRSAALLRRLWQKAVTPVQLPTGSQWTISTFSLGAAIDDLGTQAGLRRAPAATVAPLQGCEMASCVVCFAADLGLRRTALGG